MFIQEMLGSLGVWIMKWKDICYWMTCCYLLSVEILWFPLQTNPFKRNSFFLEMVCTQLCLTLSDTMGSVAFSWQEYWSELPFPPPGDRPNPGTELTSLVSPALAGGFFPSEHLGSLFEKKQSLIYFWCVWEVKSFAWYLATPLET